VKRGSLIVFEGLDGCGKSTQLPRLAKRLVARGHRVLQTAEPYDCAPGRRIRAIAKSGTAAAPEQELALFVEQRRLHVSERVAPALARGEVVLSDRYFLSTVAYQGARGLDPEALLAASEAEFPIPDLALLFVLGAAEGLVRAAGRSGPAEPVFERRDFLDRVERGFAGLDRPYLGRLDAAGSPDEVEARIAAIVSRRLGLL
jgi:dTMP kinase